MLEFAHVSCQCLLYLRLLNNGFRDCCRWRFIHLAEEILAPILQVTHPFLERLFEGAQRRFDKRSILFNGEFHPRSRKLVRRAFIKTKHLNGCTLGETQRDSEAESEFTCCFLSDPINQKRLQQHKTDNFHTKTITILILITFSLLMYLA